jgi:formate-dependent nitrite reductase membrane component NrfD
VMPLADEVQHFAGPPGWTWYILFYFFFAGLSGGSYFVATLFRLNGGPSGFALARTGYYVAFLTLLVCPVMLILDLGIPLRFWHMMWNTTPDAAGFNFKYWSPMSVGVWALAAYGFFATVSFLEALMSRRRQKGLFDGIVGRVFLLLGALLGLFIAGYTGVLLSASNQPVWSDTWALGGLFLASGLSGSAALLGYLLRYRPEAQASAGQLVASERLYAIIELVMMVIFAITLLPAGALDTAFGLPWTLLWLVALAGVVTAIVGLSAGRLAATSEGVAMSVQSVSVVRSATMTGVVLLGVLALRAAVLFSIQ